MFKGENKAITFSFDDGTTQDIRLIEILDKYGLKATFNINSELLGRPDRIIREGKDIDHFKVSESDLKKVYEGHEVAVHTLTHPELPDCDEAEIIRQVEEDKKKLSAICGYEVVGMAYPGGAKNNDARVAEIVKKRTSIKYARTITSTYNFDIQENLIRFNPTIYHIEIDKMFELAKEFLALKTDEPKLFYIWGHSFEFDVYDTWERFEEFCELISGHDDIFYGTNKEVLL